jgi:hypothetical protein
VTSNSNKSISESRGLSVKKLASIGYQHSGFGGRINKFQTTQKVDFHSSINKILNWNSGDLTWFAARLINQLVHYGFT